MKKSVIFTILIIYVFAIFIVGLIGQKLKVYEPTIFVEKIECISEDFKYYDENHMQAKKGYLGYITKNSFVVGMKVQIKCRVVPANATYKELNYICESKICTKEVDSDGYLVLTFENSGSVDVIVQTTDGKPTSIKIKINIIDLSDF